MTKMYEETINMLEFIKRNTYEHGPQSSYIDGISKESMKFVISRAIEDLKSAGVQKLSIWEADNE